MSVLDVVNSYYDAWMDRKGDFSAVPQAGQIVMTMLENDVSL